MKVEYIIILDTKKDFCKTVNSFKYFLQSDSNITISNNEIYFKNTCFYYSLQDGSIKDNIHYYDISVEFNCEDEKNFDNELKIFEELLRAIRILIGSVNVKIEVVWDDVGLYYAEKAYTKIFRIENLMRKLITKFMLINVGANWEKETVPNKVKEHSKRNKNKDRNLGYLYDIDFIDLANFLFDDYQISDIWELKQIYTNRKQIKVEELEKFLPLSNWEKFFKKIVSIDGDYLRKKWNEFYELRCNVAHNVGINASEYKQVCELYKYISEPLEKAIAELDKVTVDDESKELLAENIVVNKEEQVKNFLLKFKDLEKIVQDYLIRKGFRKRRYVFSDNTIRILLDKKLIDETLYKDLRSIISLRNIIVHQTCKFDKQVIQNLKDACNKIVDLEIKLNEVM